MSMQPTKEQRIKELELQVEERDAYLAAAHNTIMGLTRILERHDIDWPAEAVVVEAEMRHEQR